MVQTGEQAVSSASERYMLVYMIAVLVIITSLVIIFFIVFQKRKNKLLLDKIKQERLFEEEMLKAQTETQEQTLKNIGWELHDNIGQMLSFANMQLSILKMQVSNDIKEKFKDTTEALSNGLKEVRALSKTLNNDVILNLGFQKSITNELERLERIKYDTAALKVVGDRIEFKDKSHEIILFRILQEFLSNSVKYSEAKNLLVTIHYQSKHIAISAKDDGKGFNIEDVEKGSGLINMQSRAELIGARFELNSKPGKGVELELLYPL